MCHCSRSPFQVWLRISLGQRRTLTCLCLSSCQHSLTGPMMHAEDPLWKYCSLIKFIAQVINLCAHVWSYASIWCQCQSLMGKWTVLVWRFADRPTLRCDSTPHHSPIDTPMTGATTHGATYNPHTVITATRVILGQGHVDAGTSGAEDGTHPLIERGPGSPLSR